MRLLVFHRADAIALRVFGSTRAGVSIYGLPAPLRAGQAVYQDGPVPLGPHSGTIRISGDTASSVEREKPLTAPAYCYPKAQTQEELPLNKAS